MKDIYAQVTNSIIAALEQGTPPWVRPWRDGTAMPSNLATGKPYHGINFVMLTADAIRHDYTDNRWLTFNQAAELGIRVRKGEHGTPIVFYRLRQTKETTDKVPDADLPDKRIPMLRTYAFEELVAEIGAAFLCAHSCISARLEHVSYINEWLDALRRDKRLIFVAAGAAQKAADFVLGK